MARPPKPTHLKLVEGNRGKRAIPSHEPAPAFLNNLGAPEWLPDDVKKVWDEIAPKLRQTKVLTEIDIPALEAGCIAIAKYRAITLKLGNDFTNETEKGSSLNQLMIAQSMMFKQSMAIFQQFGMTPSARVRLTVNVQQDLFANDQKESNSYLT